MRLSLSLSRRNELKWSPRVRSSLQPKRIEMSVRDDEGVEYYGSFCITPKNSDENLNFDSPAKRGFLSLSLFGTLGIGQDWKLTGLVMKEEVFIHPQERRRWWWRRFPRRCRNEFQTPFSFFPDCGLGISSGANRRPIPPPLILSHYFRTRIEKFEYEKSIRVSWL